MRARVVVPTLIGLGVCALALVIWRPWDEAARSPRRRGPAVLPRAPLAETAEADAAVAEIELLAAGATHSCAVRAGRVACWGAQVDGAVGGLPGEAVSRARWLDGLPAGSVQALALGNGYSCALRDGAPWCWGTLGASERVAVAQPIAGLPALSALAAGRSQACGLDGDGAVWCWRSLAGPPARVAGLAPARALAVGGYLACVLARAGGVICWDDADADAPAPVAGLDPDVDALALGARFGCAHTSAGAVQCWGAALAGGIAAAPATPRRILASGAGAISAGDEHACALRAGGTVTCWGDNVYGQLGDGSVEGRDGLVEVLELRGARLLAAGSLHTCAAGADIQCWGSDSWRQLGRGGQPRAQGDVERVRPLPAPVEWQ